MEDHPRSVIVGGIGIGCSGWRMNAVSVVVGIIRGNDGIEMVVIAVVVVVAVVIVIVVVVSETVVDHRCGAEPPKDTRDDSVRSCSSRSRSRVRGGGRAHRVVVVVVVPQRRADHPSPKNRETPAAAADRWLLFRGSSDFACRGGERERECVCVSVCACCCRAEGTPAIVVVVSEETKNQSINRSSSFSVFLASDTYSVLLLFRK